MYMTVTFTFIFYLIQCALQWVRMSVYLEQDLDPFSHFLDKSVR